VNTLSLIDPSRITPRDWLITGVLLIVAFWLWHELIVKPTRLLDEVCEEDARMALD
jgi:hypothetical protein